MGEDSGSNLEMRCSADEAWYDGTLSFSADSKDEIVVHFNDFGDEDNETFPTSYLLDPTKLKLRVRVRSQQLQDCQCKLVSEGQKICGCLDDGEDRKYYDSKVVSIVRREHSFKDNGEECTCVFKLLWFDGPKKKKLTTVGCAEVCFLSIDAPDEDPMVKNLVESLRKSALNTTFPSPRPRTPSPSLEVAPMKKQSSNEPSPSTHRVHLGPEASAKSVGSKKKRIMQAEVMEQPDLASDNDALNSLEMDARPTTSTPNKEPSRDGSEEGAARAGHGDESDDSEQRRVRGGESNKKGFVPIEKRRLVKVKAPKVIVPAPEVVVCEEEAAVRENNTSRSSFRELVKANAKKVTTTSEVAAARDEAGVREDDDGRRPLKRRVKFNTVKTKAAPDVRKEAAAVRADDTPPSSFRELVKGKAKKMARTPEVAAVRDEAVSQTLGERVKLKSAEKSKPASQIELQKVSPHKKKSASQVESEKVSPQKKKPASHVESQKVSPQKKKPVSKVSLQKVGVQVVGKQMQKNHKQMQLEDHPSRLSSKQDELTNRPETPSRPNDVLVEPKEPQKRKPGRPRKHPLPEPVKTGTESFASKKQPVLGFSKEQKQNSQEEKIIDAANAEKQSSEPANNKKTAKKKRPREEESALPDTDDIGSNKSTQEEEETLDEAHVTKQAPGARGNKEKKTKRPLERERQPLNDDAVSDTSADDEDHTHVANEEKKTARPWDCERQSQHDDAVCDKFAGAHNMAADDDEDHTPVASPMDATNERLGYVAKKSMADGVRDIQNKFGPHRQQLYTRSVEKTPSPDAHEAITPGSSEELIGSPPLGGHQTEENTTVSQLRSQNETTKIGASGKRRRKQMVLTDDEEDDDVPKKPKTDMHGSVESSANAQDECSDPKTTSASALDEELQSQDAVKATRLLLIKNMELDVSAYDAMQLLQDETGGACAVHVLPILEFQNSATGYALYRDGGSALKAVQHLASRDRFVVSPKGRPWIVSLATNVDGPRLCGFATHTAYKSDDPGTCGIISYQPQVQNLLVVSKQRDSSAYSQALQRSKTYEEHQKWHKELHDRILQEEMKG